MSRQIAALMNGRLLIGLAAALLMATFFAPHLARRLRVARPAAYLASLSTMLIVAFTLFERIEGLGGFDVGRALTWWTELRQPLIEVARTEAAWWLNVALFVPAGLVWAVLSRHPARVAAALTGLSFGVETLQGLTGLGAADLTDLAANSFGGLLGAGAVGLSLRFASGLVPDVSRSTPDLAETRISVRWIAMSVAAPLLVAGLGYSGVQALLRFRQAALRSEMEQTFDGLTVGDINGIVDPDAVSLDPLFILEAGSPDSYQFYGDDRPVEVRYTIDFLGFYRCVLVDFTSSAPVFTDGSGDTCTGERFE